MLRGLLPDYHLRDDSKDTVKVGAGIIATVSALVLGLLVASAKNTFDTTEAEITSAARKSSCWIAFWRTMVRRPKPRASDCENCRRRDPDVWPEEKNEAWD